MIYSHFRVISWFDTVCKIVTHWMNFRENHLHEHELSSAFPPLCTEQLAKMSTMPISILHTYHQQVTVTLHDPSSMYAD